jgi:hypothetical protein
MALSTSIFQNDTQSLPKYITSDQNNSIDLSTLSAVRNMHHMYTTDKFHSLGLIKPVIPEQTIRFKSEIGSSATLKVVNIGEP